MKPNSVELTPDQMAGLQYKSIAAGQLLCWAIYDNPIDYPDRVVIRPWVADSGKLPRPLFCVVLTATVIEARSLLRRIGVSVMPHSPNDDPCMAEAWM